MIGLEALVFLTENEFQRDRLSDLAFRIIYWTAECVTVSLFNC